MTQRQRDVLTAVFLVLSLVLLTLSAVLLVPSLVDPHEVRGQDGPNAEQARQLVRAWQWLAVAAGGLCQLLPIALLIRTARVRRAGRVCSRCGHPLPANRADGCPECGFRSRSARTPRR